MKGSTYQSRINDNGIYTNQGDYVAMIEDDQIRNDVVDYLNGEKDNQELLEFLEDKDLDLKKLEELISDKEDQEEKLDKIKDELDEVKEGLQVLMDRVLLDDLQPDDWDVIHGLHKKVEELAA